MNESLLHGVWRTVVTLLGLIIALAGLYVLLHDVGVAPPIRFGASGEPSPSSPIVFLFNLQPQTLTPGLLWMLGSVVGIVVGVVLVAFGLARVEGSGRTVVLRGLDGTVLNGGGRVTVSMHSLHTLVANVAERIEGVREVQTRLQLKRAGWHVECTVAHAPDRPLPEVARHVKQQIQETLEHHTGLPVARIDIVGRLGLAKAQRRVR